MNKTNDKIAVVVLLLLTLDFGYFIDRQNFTHLFFAYTLFFATYIWVIYAKKTPPQYDAHFEQKNIDFWLKFALILRGCLLFAPPQLSDDIYRFIWDGRLINLGENPFDHLPTYYIENQYFTDTLTPELFAQLNSKNYFTVYPPFCQALFTFATWVFPKSIFGAMFLIKLSLFLCELGTLFLLKKWVQLEKITPTSALLYALNPLIIIELCGNIHFEAAMIFFFFLTIHLLEKNKTLLSGVAFALAVVSKMLPLMFLPFFLTKWGWQKSLIFGTVACVLIIVSFLPFYNPLFFNNLQNSLGLYFKKFEFNASLYYIVREFGFWHKGYNWGQQTTPYLNGIVILSIVGLFFSRKSAQPLKDFFKNCLWAFSIYLFCAATVHPWYGALPVFLCVFTRWRFPIIWSYFIFLSYIHYSYPQPTENYWVIGLEYVAVLVFIIYEVQAVKVRQLKQLVI